MKNRGGYNIDYEKGFKKEKESFKLYTPIIKYVLGASKLESTERSLVDVATGIDCYAQIQGNIYGISLRVRSKDYNSFTLNRHISDKHSEVNKWTKKRLTQIKPSYHIQIAPMRNGNVKIWRIDIDAFGHYIDRLIADFSLKTFYNDRLECYEFPYDSVCGTNGVKTFEIEPNSLSVVYNCE